MSGSGNFGHIAAREAGVALAVTEVEAPTGVALITVDGAGETTIVVAPV